MPKSKEKKLQRKCKSLKKKLAAVNKSNRSDRCANPYKTKGHVGKSLKFLSKSWLNEFPELLKNSKVCWKCREIRKKNKTSGNHSNNPLKISKKLFCCLNVYFR